MESLEGAIDVSFCFFFTLPSGITLGEGLSSLGSLIVIPLVVGIVGAAGVVAH